MKKEFHLVLSFDATNQSLMDTLQAIVVSHARQTYATALVAHAAVNDGSTKPEIHLYSDDFLMGKEDIETAALAATPPSVTLARAANAENASQQVEVAKHNGPKSVGGPSFGDEEEG